AEVVMKPDVPIPQPFAPTPPAPTETGRGPEAVREFLERIDRVLAGQEPAPLMPMDLDGHIDWLCRPFAARPTAAQWAGLIASLADGVGRRGVGLVAVDPLASFLPGRDENSASGMLEALLPLSRLTAAGAAVLLLHHPRKGEWVDGQMARGSGALAGFAD